MPTPHPHREADREGTWFPPCPSSSGRYHRPSGPGADILAGEVESALTLIPTDGWIPPVVLTQALDGTGVAAAWDAVERHRAALRGSGGAAARERDGVRRHLVSLALERMARDLNARTDAAVLDALVARVVAREIDPSAAVDTILGPVPGEDD